ncbi:MULTISPECIES: hypothetical protein [Thiorhodovibrio]|uniref:hypothetical protein n=1 Tax=Thiorhodovibrio TaxID=61593 RepID=UPI0019144CDB|nr:MULTISPECIES: hypothetical protein [Thiorhodovibrio]MBK5968794.1 hypothetical protein [Thiorhodovibrio winogradskyi]WPL12211.1 Inner membrane protein YidI [Thiorhodovibrio litoralis]
MTHPTIKTRTISLIGVVFGLLALGSALLHFWLGPLEPTPPLDEVVAEQAVKIKARVVAKLTGEALQEKPEPRTRSLDAWIDVLTVSFGFVAIACGVIAFIRREDRRATASAVLLGVGAIGFQFLALALGVIVLVILIAAVLSSLGLS